ncbi:MAG: phosphomannomutase/phosphoglucomutase [Selenomonadaceae bacterium]|nr:phosphomannomutase/phosphoglucomutase [Selenomonadaceae bacterium]
MLTEKDLMKLHNGSDVRGVAVEGVAGEPVTLTTEAVNRIASGFVKFLGDKLGKEPSALKITIGNDSRISAQEIKHAACKALVAHGVHVIDCGLASTPAMFMSTVFDDTKADGAIMLTASHLPFNRNGMKFFTRDGGLESANIKTILQTAATLGTVEAPLDSVHHFDLIERYSAHLRKIITDKLGNDKPFVGMKIIVDAGNGGGGFFATKILAPLGADTTGSQFLEPDGNFPNHIPNPEDKIAMVSIQKAVLDSKADLGLIFDTDVDRMSAVLSDGEEISRNALIAMMAAILAPDYPGSTIITDSVTSDGLHKFLEDDLKLKHHRFKRGYKNVINECIRLNKAGEISPLAIETSGHGALSENYFLDDGAYLAVKLLIAAAKYKNLSKLIDKLTYPAEGKEYRFKIVGVEDFKSYGQKVLDEFKTRAVADGLKLAEPNFEGVRINFDGGWALLRMSLHDPNMPLNVESNEAGGCAKIVATVKKLIAGFDKLDTSALDK